MDLQQAIRQLTKLNNFFPVEGITADITRARRLLRQGKPQEATTILLEAYTRTRAARIREGMSLDSNIDWTFPWSNPSR